MWIYNFPTLPGSKDSYLTVFHYLQPHFCLTVYSSFDLYSLNFAESVLNLPTARSHTPPHLSVPVIIHQVGHNPDPHNQRNSKKCQGQIIPPILQWMQQDVDKLILPIFQCYPFQFCQTTQIIRSNHQQYK